MQSSPSKANILVVEDDERIAKSLKQCLSIESFTVTLCESAQIAMDILPEFQPDLILLDLMLPGMDGVEFCLKIRPSFHKSILMLTAHEGKWKRSQLLTLALTASSPGRFAPCFADEY